MNTIQHQQEITRKVLATLCENVDGEVVTAGGAPRNWHFGELANDVDVYLRCTARSSRRLLQELLGGELRRNRIAKAEYSGVGPITIKNIVELTIEGVDFQFMVCEVNANEDQDRLGDLLMKHFDTGINRIYKTIDFVHRTTWFDKDVEEKTITLYPDDLTDAQVAHCVRYHMPKLVDYYPNHKVVVQTGYAL